MHLWHFVADQFQLETDNGTRSYQYESEFLYINASIIRRRDCVVKYVNMIALRYSFTITVLCISATTAVRDLPPYFPKCNRDDPDLNKCLLKAGNAVKPLLLKGVDELGIAPISPYFLKEVVLEQGNNAVQLKSSLHNVTIRGLETYNITQFDYDVANNKFHTQIEISPLLLDGQYKMSGKILTLPLEGKGHFVTNITYCNGTLEQEVKIVKRGGYRFMESVKSDIKIDAFGISAHMDGLFGDNEALGRATNVAINENIEAIFQEVKPVIEKVLGKMVENLQYRITRKVPYDLLYPLQGR